VEFEEHNEDKSKEEKKKLGPTMEDIERFIVEDAQEIRINEIKSHEELNTEDNASEIAGQQFIEELQAKELRIKDLEQKLIKMQQEQEKKELKPRESPLQIDIPAEPEKQLGPSTYKEEREKFKSYLSKLKDEAIGKKASDILTAVENAKVNNISSDEMLADTLFLTNQFLEKITSGKKINDRMCFDYQALAKNLNKNPLSKKITGAMTAFLGVVVLALQLPFLRYKTGLSLLSKGIIEHQGTKSIAENSIDFLEETKPKKLQGK